MSSSYRAICITHDPGLTIDGTDWSDPLQLVGALTQPSLCPQLAEHAGCELVGGRYSYPLIEVYCPIRRAGQPALRGHDVAGHWIDVEWLRLVRLAQIITADEQDDVTFRRTLSGLPECWSADRLGRFADELGELRQ